jgi:hypothetical protein
MRRVIRGVVVVGVLLTSLTAMDSAQAGTPVPGAPACPIFPADNFWNADITALPVNARSAAWVAGMNGATAKIWPDFGSSGDPAHPYGIPFTVVNGSHAKVSVSFQYASESDPGPYPLGSDTLIEGDGSNTGDRHAIIVDSSTCRLYETWATQFSNGAWHAGSGAIWDLNSNALRPDTWTSGDAAGLPILPGLLRLDEVQAGVVTHAIRVTAAQTSAMYVWPARHKASSITDPNVIPMGARLRLKASFDISHYSASTQVVLLAMQRYGLVVADNGSNWFFQGASSNNWPNQLLTELKSIPASGFEAVDTSGLMVDPNSGQASGGGLTVPPPAPPPAGTSGYWVVDDNGKVYPFGSVPQAGYALMNPTVDIEPTANGAGYWTVSAAGRVKNFGNAAFFGEQPALQAGEQVVSLSRTKSGNGYWLFTSRGRVITYGDAVSRGDMSAFALQGPVLDSVATPSGQGYYLVASDGGVFCFGDAAFHGSMGGIALNAPVQSLVPDPDGAGYWLVASDGGVFAFDAPFRGSMGAQRLNKPVSGMVSYGNGYLMVAEDGGVFNFSNLAFNGSLGNQVVAHPIVSVAGWSG